MTVNRSIHVLDKNGKKLFSVETNMRGIPRLAEWIESTDLAATLTPAMERQTEHQVKEEQAIQWREEYHTHWHDHLNAIRRGLWAVVILYLAGVFCRSPVCLCGCKASRRYGGRCVITGSISYILYCVCPGTYFWRPSENATEEWNSMHIRLSVPVLLLPAIAMLWQVYYIWSRSAMQPKGSGGIWILQGVLIAVPVIFCAFPAHHRGNAWKQGFL